MAEMGVAGTIAVAQLSGTEVEVDINNWLQGNPDVEVIDIKFATSATNEDWGSDALIIFRKES